MHGTQQSVGIQCCWYAQIRGRKSTGESRVSGAAGGGAMPTGCVQAQPQSGGEWEGGRESCGSGSGLDQKAWVLGPRSASYWLCDMGLFLL